MRQQRERNMQDLLLFPIKLGSKKTALACLSIISAFKNVLKGSLVQHPKIDEDGIRDKVKIKNDHSGRSIP